MKEKINTKYMVELALVMAIIILMAMTPLGYIRTPLLQITLLTVPVAVGAIILGPRAGAICGATFGCTSIYTALTAPSAMSAAMLEVNVFGAFFTMLVPRILEGWLCGLIFLALYKIKPTRRISYYVASLSCPLLNTVLFMGSLVLFFYKSDYIQGLTESLGVHNPVAFVIAAVGAQGLLEAIICFVVASLVTRALSIALKKN